MGRSGIMGGRLKNLEGGGVIHSKVVSLPQKILNKTSDFRPSVSKILSKCIAGLAQDTFSFTFPFLLFQSGFKLTYRDSANTIHFSFFTIQLLPPTQKIAISK